MMGGRLQLMVAGYWLLGTKESVPQNPPNLF